MQQAKANPKFRIKKGDEVVVLSGKDKGKRGKVLRVLRKEDRVLVQGVRMIKRHTRPSQVSPGGILEKEAPLHISKVALVDPKLGKPTRVGYKILDNGRKVRVAKLSGEVIDL
ncbi:MAG: 50S ribosomal protein L24 [Alphaproteobacteria bacterium]|nr:50S ribosomal protein L24 [Alphaproteobacteria bacterium]